MFSKIRLSFVNADEINITSKYENITFPNPFQSNIKYEREDIVVDLQFLFFRIAPIIFQFFNTINKGGDKNDESLILSDNISIYDNYKLLSILYSTSSSGNLYSMRLFENYFKKNPRGSQDEILDKENSTELQEKNTVTVSDEVNDTTKNQSEEKKLRTFALAYTIRILHLATIAYFFSNSDAYQWVTATILFSAQTSLRFASSDYDLKDKDSRRSSFLSEIDAYFQRPNIYKRNICY
ncbi:13718_t:CDS:2 [Dentiscutata erythropus]|uniref:13718_t:CDS:1 n=1 Tax=Dentiscutata erythropus TaxID=1348616 RepID=A0A9N9HSL5_9GLOM|nr:13718_t:CDS:2 [Dentiscutata erythropus]